MRRRGGAALLPLALALLAAAPSSSGRSLTQTQDKSERVGTADATSRSIQISVPGAGGMYTSRQPFTMPHSHAAVPLLRHRPRKPWSTVLPHRKQSPALGCCMVMMHTSCPAIKRHQDALLWEVRHLEQAHWVSRWHVQDANLLCISPSGRHSTTLHTWVRLS